MKAYKLLQISKLRLCLFSLVRKNVSIKYAEGVRALLPPIGRKTTYTFFACTKKVPKKYTKGLRALSTPGDAVKFLRFDGDTGNFHIMRKRKMRSLSLPFSDCGLTQAEFYEIFEFLLYWVLDLYRSFRAGVYGTKTGLFSRKIKFVVFDCSPAKVGAAHSRPKKYAIGRCPPDSLTP